MRIDGDIDLVRDELYASTRRGVVRRDMTGDLFEMSSGAEPQRVKTVVRDHLKEFSVKQMISQCGDFRYQLRHARDRGIGNPTGLGQGDA